MNGVRTGEVEVRDENDKTMTILGNGKRRNELELNKLENEGDERQWNDQEAAKTIAGGFVGNNSFT